MIFSICKCTKIYLEHFMGTLHTWWKHLWLLLLWVHQKYPQPTSLFLSTLLFYVHSGLDFFFPFLFWASQMSLWPLWYALPNGDRRNPASEVQYVPLNQWGDGVIYADMHVQIAVWERAKAERGAWIWYGLRRGYWSLPFCAGPMPS